MAQQLPHTERFVEVFYNLKNAGKIPSNQKVAEQIGLKSGNTITEISKGRQNIQIPHLQKFCEIYQIDLNTVLGSSELISSSEQSEKTVDQRQLIPYFEGDFYTQKDGSPQVGPLYYMDIPEFAGCTAFRIYSSSMSPLVEPGGIIFCKKIESWHMVIEYGQVYLIQLKDQRKFLKYIFKHRDSDKFLLKSANAALDTVDLPKNIIHSVWLVEGWMNKKAQ